MNSTSLWNPDDQILVLAVNILIQITLVTGVALTIAAAARRNPAARYAVLCTSLVLVLLSPVVALVMQTAGVSLVPVALNEMPHGPESTIRVGSPETPEAAVGLFQTSASDGEVATTEEIVVMSPLAGISTSEELNATTSNSQQSATPVRMVFRTVVPPLLSIWIVGALILLVRLVIGWCRLASILRSAKPATNASLTAILEEVRRTLRLTRLPDVVQSPRISGPVSAGLFRSRVVLPEWMPDRVNSDQLRDVLVHEVAHVLRRDQVFVLFQNLAAAAFWLHPLVRALNRRLAQAREEICDNYVLAATDAPSYSRTLLALTQLVQTPRPLPGTVGLFAARWKLDSRVAGLLDESRSRMTSLTMRGRALVAALALVMLTAGACGTVTLAENSNEQATTPAAGAESDSIADSAGRGDQGPVEETAAIPREQEQTSENDTVNDRVVAGRVLDDSGSAVDGASVVLPINHGFGGQRRDVVKSVTDADGAFRLEIPVNWLAPPLWNHLTTVWVYKPGFALGTANVAPQLEHGDAGNAVEISLPPEANPEFQILDETGGPASNVLVEPQHYRTPRAYEYVPQELLQHVAAETDDDGNVTIRCIEKGKLHRLLVRSVRHGAQEFRVDTLPDGGELQLREAVSLSGQVIGEDPAWTRDIRLSLTTVSPRRVGFTGAEGIADVTTDANGRFEIPLIATGILEVKEELDEALPVRMRVPGGMAVPTEEHLILQLVPATTVHGRVVRKDSQDPVSGVTVSVGYGQYHQRDSAVTDEQGEFEARVVPGAVYQQVIAIPHSDLTSVGSASSERFEVPITDEVFDLPVIELFGTFTLPGRLVDADGEPLANYDVWGVNGGRRYGFAETNDQGEFEMKLPNGVEMERYGYNTPDDVLGRATVGETDPLTLRAEEPLRPRAE